MQPVGAWQECKRLNQLLHLQAEPLQITETIVILQAEEIPKMEMAEEEAVVVEPITLGLYVKFVKRLDTQLLTVGADMMKILWEVLHNM